MNNFPYKVGETLLCRHPLESRVFTIVEKRERLESDGTHTFTYYLDHSISSFTHAELTRDFARNS